MKPAPITQPTLCAHRLGFEFAARIVSAGETALCGLVASRMVLALATEIVAPHVAAGSPLAALLAEVKT
jgi:hypothetical protein